MKIAMAKELFRNGVFHSAHLLRSPDENGWVLELKRGLGGSTHKPEILTTDRGETRVFKGIEAGLKAAESIGFEGVFVSRRRFEEGLRLNVARGG